MVKHYFRSDDMTHDLEIKIKEANCAQVYCNEHGIAVAEFKSDQLLVFGGTCMRQGGQSDTIDLDQEKFNRLDGDLDE